MISSKHISYHQELVVMSTWRCMGTPANGGCHCNYCLLGWKEDRCQSCYPESRKREIAEFIMSKQRLEMEEMNKVKKRY